MIAFLTSTLGDFYLMDEMRVGLVNKNSFIENLRSVLKVGASGLFITADPEDHAGNDRMRDEFFRAFADAEIGFSRLDVCDGRLEFAGKISEYDVIILGGGHVPTQNRFFEKIHLFDEIKKFDGALLALSAGSMNSASCVYAIPELVGEATDPSYERWLRGLGVTDCMIMPHYQYLRDVYLDGLHVVRNIVIPDSVGRKVYALVDGSYIRIADGKETVFGETYLISDGEEKQICFDGEFVDI